MEKDTFSRFMQIALIVGRLALAYLFFTQLFWKFPPSFGCPPDFAFTTGSFESGRVRLDRTSGLCDWIGIETVWADQPRPFFVADMRPINGPVISIDLGWAARLNGIFLENFAKPNIRWFGWFIWGGEALIFTSMLLGLFTRFGALTAIAISGQLMIGLGGISSPYEWEWSYNLMVVLSFLMLAFTPGRYFGLDSQIRPRLQASASTNRIAKFLLWLT